MREEVTIHRVKKLEDLIITELEKNDAYNEDLVNQLMFHIIVFSAENNHLNQLVLHNIAKEYFDKSKKELLTKIP